MLVDNALLKELEETLEDIKLLRKDVRDNPTRVSQRGQDQPNAKYLLLRDRCMERDRLFRLVVARGLDSSDLEKEIKKSGILDGD